MLLSKLNEKIHVKHLALGKQAMNLAGLSTLVHFIYLFPQVLIEHFLESGLGWELERQSLL